MAFLQESVRNAPPYLVYGGALVSILSAWYTMKNRVSKVAVAERSSKKDLEDLRADLRDSVRRFGSVSDSILVLTENVRVTSRITVKTLDALTSRLERMAEVQAEMTGTVSLITQVLKSKGLL